MGRWVIITMIIKAGTVLIVTTSHFFHFLMPGTGVSILTYFISLNSWNNPTDHITITAVFKMSKRIKRF